MSNANPNGRWEFDAQGNSRFVPPDSSNASSGSRQSNSRPTGQQTQNDERWHWPLIILSFVFGLWPVGVILLILKVTGTWGSSKPKNTAWNGAQKSATFYTQTDERTYTRQETVRASNTAEQTARQETARSGYSYTPKPNIRMPEGYDTLSKKHQQEAAAKEKRSADQTQQSEKQRAREEAKAHGLGNIGLFRGLGIGLTALFGFSTVVELTEILTGAESLRDGLSGLVALLCFAAAGIALWGVGASRSRKQRRYLAYLAMIGDLKRVSIPAIASTVGKSERAVTKDLKDMLHRGYFTHGYIDHVRSELVLEDWSQAREVDQEIPQTEPAENATVRVLRQIRSLNNDIADPEMSDKIDRIEGLTARIFRLLDEHPEKEGELRSFVSYYLPETLKLLERYAQLEAQGVEGENISSAMKQIEDMMDKVADGFEAQLDKLFATDAMDISADLKVMEQMLQKDGLTTEEDPFAAAAAPENLTMTGFE